MQSVTFEEIVESILRRDPRFARDAYQFVRESLDHTQRQVYKNTRTRRPSPSRHVTGQQLLEGIREYTLQCFGPMSLFVLHEWRIHRCEDFGEIVFNLVEHGHGMFGKTENDSREDFKGGYDFTEAFSRPFLPSHPCPTRPNRLREA